MYKYGELQVFDATQKLSCKANCKTPFFFSQCAFVVHACTTYIMHVVCEIDQRLQTSHVSRHEMGVQIKNLAKGKLRTSSFAVFGPPQCAITPYYLPLTSHIPSYIFTYLLWNVQATYLPTPSTYQPSCNIHINYLVTFLLTYITNDVK